MALYYYEKYNSNYVTTYVNPLIYTADVSVDKGASYTYDGYPEASYYHTASGGWGVYYGHAKVEYTIDVSNPTAPQLLYNGTGETRERIVAFYTGGTVWELTRDESWTVSSEWEKGSYDSTLIAEDGTYTDDARDADGYWYLRKALAITATVTTTTPATVITHESATIAGAVTNAGSDNPTIYLEWGETVTDNSVEMGVYGVSSMSTDLTGLDSSTTYYFRIKAINEVGTTYGDTESFATLEMPLSAPTINSPENDINTTDRTPTFDFNLTDTPLNDAVLYSARIRISKTVDMAILEQDLESKDSEGTWEVYDGSWSAMATAGEDPDSRVRVTLTTNLDLRQDYYWDVASWDGSQYGFNSTPRKIRAVMSVDGWYAIEIDSVAWNVRALEVVETSNGEIGAIRFDVNADSGTIEYGDDVVLGMKDIDGNTEEFEGVVRGRYPTGTNLGIIALLGGSVLSERISEEDWISQDVGVTLKDAIDTYCSPLTSTGIDITLGLEGPEPGIDKTILQIFEELRRRYGYLYYIDSSWDAQVYMEADMDEATVLLKYGNSPNPREAVTVVRTEDTDAEWDAGTLVDVEAVSDELVLENTAGVYETTGNRVSPALSLDTIETVTATDITWDLTQITATNLVINGDFTDGANWSPSGGTESVASNIYSLTGDGSSPSPRMLSASGTGTTPVSTHKYYIKAKVRVDNSNCLELILRLDGSTGGTAIDVETQSNPVINTWYELSGIGTEPGDWTGEVRTVIRTEYADAATANTTVFEIDGIYGVLIIDLTLLYGAGNEPSVAECDVIFATWFDTTGSVDDVRIVVSTGVNTSSTVAPTSWSAATKGGDIPDIAVDDDLSGKYLWIKQVLVSDTTNTPHLESLAVDIDGTVEVEYDHTFRFIHEPRVTTKAPVATHVRVKSSSHSYTAVIDPAPATSAELRRYVEISEGDATDCQEIADALLARWSVEQISLVGKIPLTVVLSFKEKVGVTIDWADISGDMIIQKKRHTFKKKEISTELTLGDIILTDDELITRLLDEILNKDKNRHFGDEDNYTDITKDGHQTMAGDGRPWRDELHDAINIEKHGARITVDEVEGVVDITTSADEDDYMFLNVQLNHDRDPSTNIDPHIHFFADDEGNYPNFLLKYRWQINGGTKTTAWTDYKCNTPVFTAPGAGVTIQQICEGASIAPPAGTELSDIVQFRIIRDNDNDSGEFAGADPFTGTVGILSFDVHLMINSLGSDTEYTK